MNKMMQLLPVQNSVHFRSTVQLNNSGFPPGPANSFNFAWSVVSRVLYPQELLWTVRGISSADSAHTFTPCVTHLHLPCVTQACHKLQAVLPALLRCPQARLRRNSSQEDSS